MLPGPVTTVLPTTPFQVVSIGAVHHDTLAHAATSILPETSTPAVLTSRPGGVATNIARALVRLDVETHLAGTVGNDAAGEALQGQLSKEGLGLSLMPRQGFSTGQYVALHDPDGGLTAACVDDRILSEAPADFFDGVVKSLLAASPENAIWFLDANLPENMLIRLTGLISDTKPAARLIANAVSNAKAPRLAPVLSYLDCLLLNRGEAAALTSFAVETPIEDLAARLSNLGLRRFVLTDGASELLLFEAEQAFLFTPFKADVVDVTGAGDALTAGTLAALAKDFSYKEAIPYGLAAADLTLRSTGALSNDLSWNALSTS